VKHPILEEKIHARLRELADEARQLRKELMENGHRRPSPASRLMAREPAPPPKTSKRLSRKPGRG
jgi:hypothetical protein